MALSPIEQLYASSLTPPPPPPPRPEDEKAFVSRRGSAENRFQCHSAWEPSHEPRWVMWEFFAGSMARLRRPCRGEKHLESPIFLVLKGIIFLLELWCANGDIFRFLGWVSPSFRRCCYCCVSFWFSLDFFRPSVSFLIYFRLISFGVTFSVFGWHYSSLKRPFPLLLCILLELCDSTSATLSFWYFAPSFGDYSFIQITFFLSVGVILHFVKYVCIYR